MLIQIYEIFCDKFTLITSSSKSLLQELAHGLVDDLKLNELSSMLKNLLNEIHVYFPDESIFIFLDGLDHLESDDLASMTSWVLTNLAPNTKLVYTCRTNLLDKFQKKLRKPECFIEISALNTAESLSLLSMLLSAEKRSISATQKEIVRLMFEKVDELHPLYIRLIADLASQWKSSATPNEVFKACLTGEDCIRYLFKRWEEFYGEKFVSRCLFYFNEFKAGVNSHELADIFTLDDELLQSVFTHYLPQYIQFPIQILKSFENDLKKYLHYKMEDEVAVMCWRYTSFLNVSKELYLNTVSKTQHESNILNMYHYFMGTYTHKEKEFFYISEKKGSTTIKSTRPTRPQTLLNFKLINQKLVLLLNRRKLSELPGLLLKFDNTDFKLNALKKHVFFNFEFIYAKLLERDLSYLHEATRDLLSMSKQLAATNQEATESIQSVIALNKVILKCSSCLKKYPNTFIDQIRARIIDYVSHNDIYLESLLNENYARVTEYTLKYNQWKNDDKINSESSCLAQLVPMNTFTETNLNSNESLLFTVNEWNILRFWTSEITDVN